MIYLEVTDLLVEPEELNDAPAIKGTLDVHRFDRCYDKKGVPYIKFYEKSDDGNQLFTQWYTKEGDEVCGHEDQSISENECGRCGQSYRKRQPWIECPGCTILFHEKCQL